MARNNLFKCAVFGNDPNWGRVLAAVGTTRAAFDPATLDVSMNGIQVCRAGGIGEPRELVDLSGHVVARGVVGFDAAELPALIGRKTGDLPPEQRREVVHADDLVPLRA